MTAPVLAAMAAALLGLLGGIAYFAALKASLRLTDPRWLAVAMVLRLAAAGLLFWLAVQFGAAPLLAALAGFLAARTLALRRTNGMAAKPPGGRP